MAGGFGARHSTLLDRLLVPVTTYTLQSISHSRALATTFTAVCGAVFSCTPLPTVAPQSQAKAPPTLACESGSLTSEQSEAKLMLDDMGRRRSGDILKARLTARG